MPTAGRRLRKTTESIGAARYVIGAIWTVTLRISVTEKGTMVSMADFTIDVYEINERRTMTRSEIADRVAGEIVDLIWQDRDHIVSRHVIKLIVLSGLLEMMNDQVERDLESTRKQLAAIRGDGSTHGDD